MNPDAIRYLITSMCRGYEARTGDAPTHVHLGAEEHAALLEWVDGQKFVRDNAHLGGPFLLGGVEVLRSDVAQGIALEVRREKP